MGLRQEAGRPPKVVPQDLQERMQEFYSAQVESLGLSKEQIEGQRRQELERSLETVKDAISKSESFGIVRFRVAAGGGIVVAGARSDFHFEVGILPILLESKRLALDRLALLRSREKVESLTGLIENVADEEIRAKLNQELDGLESEARFLREKQEETRREQERELVRIQAESAERIAELAARLESTELDVEQLNNTLEHTRRDRDRYSFLLRLSLGVVFAIVGVGLILMLPSVLSWQWLVRHPSRLGLEVCAILAVLGVSWIIVDMDKNRRWFALGSVVLATIIAIVQML